MNVENLLMSDLKTMCVAFFNITSQDANGNFIIKSEYRESKWAKISLDGNVTEKNNILLNNQTSLDFNIIKKGHHEAIINNDNGRSLEDFFDDLYVRIESHRNSSDFKTCVLLSCFALRGSYDKTFGMYAVDLYSSNEAIDNYRIGVLNLARDASINPERDLRNKQIRVKLSNFKSELEMMKDWNIYKYSKH